MIIEKLKRKRPVELRFAAREISSKSIQSVPPLNGSGRTVAPSELENRAFLLEAPFGKALKLFREAALDERLRIPMEMDVAGQIRNELGIGLRPCCVLCIDCPYLLLQAAVWDGSGAAFLPVRLVFTSCESGTSIRFVGPLDAGLPNGLRIPFGRFLGRLLSVLEHIGARKPGLPAVS